MTSSPTTPAAGIQDAARHLAEARADEAVAVLERIVADFPAYVTAYVLLAKSYEASGRQGDALDAWHRAYFLMPSSPLVVRERTRLLRTAPLAAEPAAAESVTPETPSVASEPSVPEDEPLATPPGGGLPEAHEALEPSASAPTEVQEEDAEAEEPGETEPVAAEPDVGEEAAEGVTVPTESLLLTDEVDDLDTLIQQLENAPRIRPDADFKDDRGEPEEEDEEEVVSETLARIYEAQKQYAAAARAYEQLADQRPDRATELLSKAAEMRRLSGQSGD